MSGVVLRVHPTFEQWVTPDRLDSWVEADPNASLAVSHGGTFLQLTASRVGAASFPAGIARYSHVTERVSPHGAEDWLVQIALTAPINVVGAIGIGIFSPDLAQHIAVETDGATITRRGVGTTTFTANGATTSVGAHSWLRITYTASSGVYEWLYSADGSTWTSLGTEAGRTFTSTQPTFQISIYWRSGDTSGSSYSIGVQKTEWYDMTQHTASRFGNHCFIANGVAKVGMYHFQSLLVKQGDFVKAGQVIGYCGSTGFDVFSGQVINPHCHIEYFLANVWYSYDANSAINILDALLLPRSNVSNNVTVTLTRENDPEGNDSHRLRIVVARADQDFDDDSVTLVGPTAYRTVAFNARIGYNPADPDANNYNGVRWVPTTFTGSSSTKETSYYFQVSTVGSTVTAWAVGDTQGRTLASANLVAPSDISNLVLWLNSSSVVNTAGAAETLVDLGPNDYDLTQSSAIARAAIVSNDPVFGGRPSLSFSGAQWYERSGLLALPCLEGMTVVTIGSVTTATAAGPRGFLMYTANLNQSGGVYTAPYFYERVQATGLCRALLQTSFDTDLAASSNVAHCWIATHDGGSELRVYRDATEMSPTPASRTASISPTAPLLRVGTTDLTVAAPAAASFLVGKLGAILVYDRVLNATERGQILTWARCTYGTP